MLKVVLASEFAKLPQRATSQSAGLDIFASAPSIIPAGGLAVIETGLKVQAPSGTYCKLASRSSLASANIHVGAGIIDADYRGPVKVVLYNLGSTDFYVKVGQKIAQMILVKICMVAAQQAEELDETERGCGGFGSTGLY